VIRKLVLAAILVVSAGAQAPKIGAINFYGLRRETPDRLLKAAGLEVGAQLGSKGALEDKLETISGVVAARVEAVCCEGRDAILFIGIEERGAPHFDIHSAPGGTATLPEDLVTDYREYLRVVQRAAQRGEGSEDYSSGEPRIHDPAALEFEERFRHFAADNVALLRDVLRNTGDAEQRAVAASLIVYAPKKVDILNDLQYALQDADESVRANAVRSLKAVAVLAQKRQEMGLKVSPTWFVEMLNSLVLSDRQQAAEALVILTDAGNTAALDLMRDRALGTLVEMARWKTLRYALPAYLLVGRMAGVSDTDLHQQWQRGDRESAIKLALVPPKLRK
jgi:hypothetical protein